MKNLLRTGGLALLVSFPYSYSYAQDIHSAVRSSMLNSARAILYKSNPEAIKRLDEIRIENEIKAKKHLEMFLKCDGKNGNVDMGIDGNPEYFLITDKGKCAYVNIGGN